MVKAVEWKEAPNSQPKPSWESQFVKDVVAPNHTSNFRHCSNNVVPGKLDSKPPELYRYQHQYIYIILDILI
jgi:hypothetical protein